MSEPETNLPGAPSLTKRLTLLLKVSRPGFYLTTLWFFLLPLGQRDMFGSWEFWLGAVYVCFPLGLLMYGWNDIMDIETDKLNPRKDSFLFGARVLETDTAFISTTMVWVQLPFVAAFIWIAGWKMAGWFAVACVVNAAYNAPKWGFKNHPVVDVLNQAGYLLVFVLSSWLNDVPQLKWDVMVFAALFAMHSHLFGQLMDIDEDRAAGRKTTAGAIGVRGGKMLMVLMMVVEAVLIWNRDVVVAGFLAFCAGVFLVDVVAVFRGRAYPSWAIKTFFIAWNVVAFISLNWIWSRGTLVG